MKRFVQKLLAYFARAIINKYKPTVIGVTGSVGKTSTREAVFFVVSQKYKARRAAKNFNDELGLPLAIIGSEDNPQKQAWGWIIVMCKGLWWLLFRQSFPEVLILEYGVDRVGDMDYLVSLVRPSIAIITNIGVSHYEFFKSAETIMQEKGKLAEALTADGTLVVNADNPNALAQQHKTQARIVSYGLDTPANVKLTIENQHVNGIARTDLVCTTPTRQFPAQLHALGKPHLEAVAAAVAVGEALDIETDLIQKGIAEYKPAASRLNILEGIKHSVIIDDTYNAAPDSMRAALDLLQTLPGNYKMAVLGDMRELGALSDEEHTKIGQLVATLNIHRLFTIGEKGKLIAQAAIAAGFPESKVSSWENADVAKSLIVNAIEEQSLILVKGSQFVRLEKIVKEIMAEPMRAHELVCRQYGSWLEN